jgi:RES domain-containing protein
VTLAAHRITKAAFAATIWSGVGARDYGGRWNSKGVAVVYAAQSLSLAALEQLVHLSKPRALKGYVTATITFDDRHLRRIATRDLPADWHAPVAPPALRKVGDDWVAAGGSAVLAVPSAVTPGEWNYLFNPAHRDFAGLAKSAIVPFAYDSRLG